MSRAVDVAAAATCRRQNADEYKSMEIVAVAFDRRTRQKIEIQNKLLIIKKKKKNGGQKCSDHDNDTNATTANDWENVRRCHNNSLKYSFHKKIEKIVFSQKCQLNIYALHILMAGIVLMRVRESKAERKGQREIFCYKLIW